jgi:hypothetical protein
MYLKLFFSKKLSQEVLNLEKSNFSSIFNSELRFKIRINSFKESIHITSIQGIIDASIEFHFGTNILLKPFSFAQIVIGKTESMTLNFQSRDNSPTKTESLINLSSVIHQSFLKIQIAIGKSKLGHDFLILAGARFTVILVVGNLVSLDFIADFNLSLLSCTHWSGKPTIVKAGKPLFISTSTSTIVDSSQLIVIAFV